VETTYVAGPGVLLGAGHHWLLLDDVPDTAVLGRWFTLIRAGVGVTDRLLAELDRHYRGAQPSLVLVDLTPGQERVELRGRGVVTEQGPDRLLDVGHRVSGASRPFLGGIVAATSARLAHAATLAAPPGPVAIIDGIPAEILASSRPGEPPVEQTRARAVDPDHDGHTSIRSDHLEQPTHETVLAAMCPHGHPTPSYSPTCRVCQAPVPPQEPQRLPRPTLGRLALPTGEHISLDRAVVLGRTPVALPGSEPWPHLVTLPQDSTYLSRVHLHVELDGWLVIARDLGSRGGTTLRVPGRAPERIRANEPHVLEPGHRLDLADVYEIVFEVTP
jgi:hypothetical protein